METIMEIRGITKTFPGTTALNNVNLILPKGKIIGLLGPNGSGKTTLIKLAAGLLVPTHGQITIGREPRPARKPRRSFLICRSGRISASG